MTFKDKLLFVITYRGDPPKQFWHSNAIVKRLSSHAVATVSGTVYTLRGRMVEDKALTAGHTLLASILVLLSSLMNCDNTLGLCNVVVSYYGVCVFTSKCVCRLTSTTITGIWFVIALLKEPQMWLFLAAKVFSL